jgi:hypothetical protein
MANLVYRKQLINEVPKFMHIIQKFIVIFILIENKFTQILKYSSVKNIFFNFNFLTIQAKFTLILLNIISFFYVF